MDVRYWSLTAAQRGTFLRLCGRLARCEVHPSVERPDRWRPGDWHFHLKPLD
jgi:hypothetical protein